MDANVPITTQDLSEAVRSTAMLADVTISVWSGEKTDQALMDEVKTAHGATGNVGRTVKNMLAGADGPLKETKSAFGAVRNAHYALTLPWVSNPHALRERGPRLLPNMLFERYLSDMGTLKRAALARLDAFIVDYPDLVVRAQANLGTMADVSYPDASEVRAQFAVTFDFEPLPAATSFKGLPAHFIDKLSSSLENKQQRMIKAAQDSMWSDVKERVRHMIARLGDPEAKFRATTIENVRELTTLLPAWNVAGDARVDEIVYDIGEILYGIKPEDLRKDAKVRGDVAEQATALSDKLTQWGL